MSKDSEMMIEQGYAPERPERDARFFARMGWVLALAGAGSFFSGRPWRRWTRASRCKARWWSRASARPCNP